MQHSKFVVEGLGGPGRAGKKTLKGEIAVAGAKNAVLKALAATLLFEDEVQILNVPDIEDVDRMLELLRLAGMAVERGASQKDSLQKPLSPSRLDGGTARPRLGFYRERSAQPLLIRPSQNLSTKLDKKIAERLRASIVLAGPMLARCGEVSFPFPGGCVLGERPIDLFVEGFKAMGAHVSEQDSYFTVRAGGGKLKGAHIVFPFVSVTATETLMLAALLADGETILENAAMEPEIPHLAAFLNMCGADIQGAGTNTIRIHGVELLSSRGKAYRTLPDRIETGSFIILAALAGSEVTITDCIPSHCGALIALMRRAGVSIETTDSTIVVRGANTPNEKLQMISVRTHEYPGFPTDLQAPMAVFMSQVSGEGTILETIFDGRFRYADDLVRMGADITVMNPHRILIRGPRKLSRKDLESPDLRGGLAYIIAAAVAEGTSVVRNAYLIDRGYEHIEERLQKLGLNITREIGDE